MAVCKIFTSKLVDTFKNQAMKRDSVGNCGETWCKVKVVNSYAKKYIFDIWGVGSVR